MPRATWAGTKVPPRAPPTYGDVQVAFVHHTVTANDYGPAESAAIVLGIAKYHRDTNGWNDIGYNFLVDRYGQVFEGRAGGVDQAVVGAQAQGYNSHSTGVAVLGTYSSAADPEAALEAIAHARRVEALAPRRAGRGPGRPRLRRRRPQPLPRRGTGHPPADLRPPRRRRDVVPRQRRSTPSSRRSAPGRAATPSRPTRPRRPSSSRSRSRGRRSPTTARRRSRGPSCAPTASRPPGLPVQVQRRGRTGFATIARTTTDGDGAWAVSVPWHVTGDVRVAVLGAVSPRGAGRVPARGQLPAQRAPGRRRRRRPRRGAASAPRSR